MVNFSSVVATLLAPNALAGIGLNFTINKQGGKLVKNTHILADIPYSGSAYVLHGTVHFIDEPVPAYQACLAHAG